MKRWLILLAGFLGNLCQGAAYSSSVFAVPMLTHLGLTIMKNGKPAPDMAKWALAFSMNLGMLFIGMLLAGKIADQKGPRICVMVGGTVFGLGMLLGGFAHSFIQFALTFGIMMGLGSGIAYGAIVATSIRWFPDMRGLASGLTVGALGLGTVIIVLLADVLMGPEPGRVQTVAYSFKLLGASFLVIMVISSLIMTNPPTGFVVGKAAVVGGTAPAASEMTWKEMMSTGRFWMLYILYACGAFSGLMIISQAKQIYLDIPVAGAKLGMASWFVIAIAMANAFGRFAWGTVSDWIGRMWALTLMFLITGVTMFMLPKLSTEPSMINIAGIFIGLCFGGYLGTFPALCGEAFGVKNMAVNYALLFSAFSLAAITGPYVGGYIKNTTGAYDKAFTVAAIVCTVGFVLALIATLSKPKEARAGAHNLGL